MIPLLLHLFLILLPACGEKTPTRDSPPCPVVKVALAESKELPRSIKVVGHIEAYRTVTIMAEVDGILKQVHFEAGADVKKGDLLYSIDRKTHLANLQKARGQLEQMRAKRDYSRRRVNRYSDLVREGYTSPDDYDEIATQALVEEGVVTESSAEVENANIALEKTAIHSPIDGRAGANLVDAGNLILSTAKTPLVTLCQLTPVYATFFLSAKELPSIQQMQKEGQPIRAIVKTESRDSREWEGNLSFIDNQIDPATGMIRFRATLSNEEQELWPNQYIQIHLLLGRGENCTLIPRKAVQNGPKGKYIFVLKEDQTVEKRRISTGQIEEGDAIAIETGVVAGETVITEGQLNLQEGSRVTIDTAI